MSEAESWWRWSGKSDFARVREVTVLRELRRDRHRRPIIQSSFSLHKHIESFRSVRYVGGEGASGYSTFFVDRNCSG